MKSDLQKLQIFKVRDASDKLSLRYALYNFSESTKSFIVFANGRTEFIEKYEFVFRDLNLPSDCALLTWDHRGQGDSGGARGFVESYDHFANDMKKIIDSVIGKRPYVFFGHSMGALVGLYGAMKGLIDPEKMILLSPLLGLPNKPLSLPVARTLSFALTKIKLGPLDIGTIRNHKMPFEENKLTFSAKRFKELANSKKHMPAATFGWIHATFLTTDFIFEDRNIMRLKPPVLILGGASDVIVDTAQWKNWVMKANGLAQNEIQFEIMHHAKHELLLELPQTYEKVLDRLKSFFSEYF